MNAPFGVLFPALAIGAAAVAIVAGSDYAIAVPFAAGGVAAAAVAVLEAGGRLPRRRPTLVRPAESVVAGVRPWFRGGSFGRAAIVEHVDRLDRRGDHPDLPIRSPAEVATIVRLPDDEFRAYVRSRLDAIEGNE